MKLTILPLILLISSLIAATKNFQETYKNVNSYIQEQSRLNSLTVPNSNKIGLGYNLLYGSPVCYSGSCQMDGYALPIFKLNYTQQPQGSCTDKMLPENVFILCLPYSEVNAGTEVIDSLEQLQQSSMKDLEISASGKYKIVSASYKYSSHVQNMIDNIVKSNQEILYTTIKISTMKLTMFESLMTLRDEFQYTIENLPCCDYDRDTERYIFDSIFSYFGFTYINSLVLGGIAQQNILINKTQLIGINQSNVDKSHEAQAEFYVSLGIKHRNSTNTSNHNDFMQLVKKMSLTKLGGDTSIQTFEEWSKTVPLNPAVIKLGVKYWFDLLDEKRFPNDKNIIEKKKLIEQAFNKYLSDPVFCYNDCSSNGFCQSTGYFQFGMCKCNEGWSGLDCLNKVPKTNTHSGTLCGLEDVIVCGNASSSASCPSKWRRVPQAVLPTSDSPVPYQGIGLSFCSKLNTDIETNKKGTICGLSYGNLLIRCEGRNPNSEQCPIGYERGEMNLWGAMTRLCYKTDDTIDDRPGTICGLQTILRGKNINNMLITEVACDGYYPGRGSCPPNYVLYTGQATIEAPLNIYRSAIYNISVSVCSTLKNIVNPLENLISSIG